VRELRRKLLAAESQGVGAFQSAAELAGARAGLVSASWLGAASGVGSATNRLAPAGPGRGPGLCDLYAGLAGRRRLCALRDDVGAGGRGAGRSCSLSSASRWRAGGARPSPPAGPGTTLCGCEHAHAVLSTPAASTASRATVGDAEA